MTKKVTKDKLEAFQEWEDEQKMQRDIDSEIANLPSEHEFLSSGLNIIDQKKILIQDDVMNPDIKKSDPLEN